MGSCRVSRRGGFLAVWSGSSALAAALRRRRAGGWIDQRLGKASAPRIAVDEVMWMAGISTMRQPAEAKLHAERALELSDAHSFPQFSAVSRVVLGRAVVELQHTAEGEALIADGIGRMTSTGSARRPHALPSVGSGGCRAGRQVGTGDAIDRGSACRKSRGTLLLARMPAYPQRSSGSAGTRSRSEAIA